VFAVLGGALTDRATAAFNAGTPSIPINISAISGRNPRARKAIDDDKRMRTSKECVNEMTTRAETETVTISLRLVCQL
jgi:glyoxylate carboligase